MHPIRQEVEFHDYSTDSDDDEPRIATPDYILKEREERQRKYNFSYINTANGRIKLLEVFFNFLVFINVVLSRYIYYHRAQAFLIVSILATFNSFGFFFSYVLRRVDKKPNIPWIRLELLLNTLIATMYLASTFFYVILIHEVARTFKKVSIAGIISLIAYLYDASLKFVIDEDNFHPKLMLKDQKDAKDAKEKKGWVV